jgi:hypothetical protein
MVGTNYAWSLKFSSSTKKKSVLLITLVSADLLYTTLENWWAQLLVIGSGQFQYKQPCEPKSERTSKNLPLENSNIA